MTKVIIPPKYKIVAAGCGVTFASKLMQPGGSEFFDSLNILYSKESFDNWLDYKPSKKYKYVSISAARELSNQQEVMKNNINIAVTASLATTRQRTGLDQAFARITLPNYEVIDYQILFDNNKYINNDISRARRVYQDEVICNHLLDIPLDNIDGPDYKLRIIA